MSVQLERVPWTPQLYRVMAGLMVSLFVAAMDSTVVGTALPTIARDLGSFQLYPRIVAGYLITATTTVPLWGRLADLHVRRRVLLVGIVVFVVASALCATSSSMIWLIAFRTLQGIGAGCIQPIVFTILGDIFPLKQRAPLSGLFSSMWAIAAIIGPALGALFVSTIGWRWIFLINLPLGVVAAALVWGYMERRPKKAGTRRLDVRGSLLLTAGVVLLLVGLGAGGPPAPAASRPRPIGCSLLPPSSFSRCSRAWSGGVPVPRCLLICSATASSVPPLPLAPSWALSCSASPRTCRSGCRRSRAARPSKPALRSARCLSAGPSFPPSPASLWCASVTSGSWSPVPSHWSWAH